MTPEVVVVGAASRDIAADDPRGWRLGGGVTYSALTTARLCLRTGAVIGVDGPASGAAELDLLRDAGVDVRLVSLARGPVFENIEAPGGRRQVAFSRSDMLSAAAIPPAWRDAGGWILASVAAELDDDLAAVPPSAAVVAVGWQGLLRELSDGGPVVHRRPEASAILGRADIAGISRDDLDADVGLASLASLLRLGATLAFTHGDRGGLTLENGRRGPSRLRHYPAVPTHRTVDPTGAGDVFLAALAAARIRPDLVPGGIAHGRDLHLAAAAASVVIEGPGLHGVGDRAAVLRRMLDRTGPA